VSGPNDYVGQDLAPYRRFRKTRFYGGCYTADIQYCNWVCDNCWSRFGWKTSEPKYELDADEVVKRLVRGMRRHHFIQARITGGEPTLYWDSHLRFVAAKFIEETNRDRRRVGLRRLRPFLVVETNGTLLRPDQIEAFEEEVGEDAQRLQITVGLKATSTEKLVELTGHTPRTAERFREKQLELIDFLAQPERIVGLNIVLLDTFCEDADVQALGDHLDAIRAEGSEAIEMQTFRTTGWGSQKHAQADYTPRRHRV
jgi:uncharacterized Fe-S cluster-containing radical SAM superfamily protein